MGEVGDTGEAASGIYHVSGAYCSTTDNLCAKNHKNIAAAIKSWPTAKLF